VIAVAWWQAILGGLGHVLAWLYDLIPNYGVAIILLTVGIRLILLPLGIKQIRAMQAMTALAPKLKAIQQKHKGNKQKLMEEQQKLYQEHGVNPLAGCLPMLLQFPVLIALYAVLRFPANVGAITPEQQRPYPSSHIPVHSRLYTDIVDQRGGIHFLGTNLLCSAGQAGTTVELKDRAGKPFVDQVSRKPLPELDCGHGIPVRIPYYVLALLMIGTTYFQQRQMQKANPSASQQQQMLTRIMPLLFGFWGFIFPAGLVLYWTTSNLAQIGLQHFIVVARKRQEAAMADGRVKPKETAKPAARKTRFSEWMERAAQADRSRKAGQGSGDGSGTKPLASEEGKAGETGSSDSSSSSGGKSGSGGSSTSGRSGGSRSSASQRSSGGRNAGSRKKRRKR
jgi:YidC/Oxa1 family membrane protein insertase